VRAADFDSKRLGQDAVNQAGKTLQILQTLQTLALSQDPEQGKKQKTQSLDADAPPDAGIRNRPEVADQTENDCGRDGLEHREDAIPPTSNHAPSPGKKGCTRL